VQLNIDQIFVLYFMRAQATGMCPCINLSTGHTWQACASNDFGFNKLKLNKV